MQGIQVVVDSNANGLTYNAHRNPKADIAELTVLDLEYLVDAHLDDLHGGLQHHRKEGKET